MTSCRDFLKSPGPVGRQTARAVAARRKGRADSFDARHSEGILVGNKS